MNKILVTSSAMYVDLHLKVDNVVEPFRPSVVFASSFMASKIANGDVSLIQTLPETASDANWLKFYIDSDKNLELAISSYMATFDADDELLSEAERIDAELKAQALIDLANEEAKRLADEEAKRLADEEAKRLADEEAKRLADEEAKRLADEEAKRLADEEAKRLADEEAKRLADEEAKRLADEEAKRLADEEAKRLADEEAKRLADEEAKRLADEEAKRLADEDAKRLADSKKGKGNN